MIKIDNSITKPFANLNYLRLDCTNGPLTGDLLLYQTADTNLTLSSAYGNEGGESVTLDMIESGASAVAHSFGTAYNFGFRWLYDPDTNNLSLSTGEHTTVTEILSINYATPVFDFKSYPITTTNNISGDIGTFTSGVTATAPGTAGDLVLYSRDGIGGFYGLTLSGSGDTATFSDVSGDTIIFSDGGNITTTGTLGAGAITGTSLDVVGAGDRVLTVESTDHNDVSLVLKRTGNAYIDYRIIDIVGYLHIQRSIDDGANWIDEFYNDSTNVWNIDDRRLKVTSAHFPVVDMVRDTATLVTSVFGGGRLKRLMTGGTAVDNSGIGFYFSTPNDAGEDTYAGVFSGILSDVSDGSEVGELMFAPSWHNDDPSNIGNAVLRVRATANKYAIIIDGDNKLYAESGTFNFDDDNIATTGTLGAGATTVTSLQLNNAWGDNPITSTISGLDVFEIDTSITNGGKTELWLRSNDICSHKFQSDSDGTPKTGLFELDAAGNMVFRAYDSAIYFDFYDNLYFRDVSVGYAQRLHVNSVGDFDFKEGDLTHVGGITGTDVDLLLGTGYITTTGTLEAGAITGTSLLINGNSQLGDSTDDIHGINTAPEANAMLTSSFTNSTDPDDGVTYFSNGIMTDTGGMSTEEGRAIYGNDFDLTITGVLEDPEGEDPSQAIYGDYRKIKSSVTFANIDESVSQFIYNTRTSTIFDGVVDSDARVTMYGNYNYVQGNLAGLDRGWKYGTWNYVIGTGQVNYGGYFDVSGATANYAIYCAAGDIEFGSGDVTTTGTLGAGATTVSDLTVTNNLAVGTTLLDTEVLTVLGAVGTSGVAGQIVNLTSGAGYAASGTGIQSATQGGNLFMTSGVGGASNSSDSVSVGASGGTFGLFPGAGGDANGDGIINAGGAGGTFSFTGRAGGDATGSTSSPGNNTGGSGSSLGFLSGTGGAASNGAGTNTGGAGGTVTLASGLGGSGSTTNGANGNIIFKSGSTEIARFDCTAGAVGTLDITTTATQLRLTHTDGTDETDFYTNSDGELEIMPTARTIYLGDGTAGDGTFGFYGSTSVYTLIHDDSASTLSLSANDATNYTQFAADGIMTMAGTARVTKSIWLGVQGIKAPGTKPAIFKEWGISGVWEFSDGTDDTVIANLKFPEDMDMSVAPTFTVGWSTNTAVTTETCTWQLEYLYTQAGEDVTAAAQGTLTVDSNAIAQADGLIVATITGLAVPNAADVCMHCRVKRLGAGGNDDLTDTAEMSGMCLSYTVCRLGTAT